MISSKRYVEEDSQGALRVGPLGVSLDVSLNRAASSRPICRRRCRSLSSLRDRSPPVSSVQILHRPGNRGSLAEFR